MSRTPPFLSAPRNGITVGGPRIATSRKTPMGGAYLPWMAVREKDRRGTALPPIGMAPVWGPVSGNPVRVPKARRSPPPKRPDSTRTNEFGGADRHTQRIAPLRKSPAL